MTTKLKLDHVHSYLWQKQGFDLLRPRSSYALVNEIIGIYGTAPTCYLSLLARTPKFSPRGSGRGVVHPPTIAQNALHAASQFLVSKSLIPVLFQATKATCQAAFRNLVEKSGVPRKKYERAASRIEQLLATEGMTVSELKKALPSASAAVRNALNFIVALMCAEGRLIRARTRGSWKSDLCEYTTFQNGLPEVDLESIEPAAVRVVVARHYFEAFGPATAEDFQWWSGFSKPESENALSELAQELMPVDIAGLDGDYFILKKNAELLDRVAEQVPQNVALLPVWDAYLMAYKNRQRYLSEPWYEYVYDKGGNATSAILLNGIIGGVWDMEEKKQQLYSQSSAF